MRYLTLTLLILLFSACQELQKKDLNLPWYINERIKTGTIENYNFIDSLIKYQTLKKSEISNLNKYESYIIDLQFKIGKKSTEYLIDKIDRLKQLNQKEFCEKIIKPALKYITPNNRPYRRYSKPYITEIDFDYFIKSCIECDYIENNLNTKFKIGKLNLSNIMLKDQWFRIPDRKKSPDIQGQYDFQNRKNLNKLYKSNYLNLQDKEIRSNIYVLLLHSTDCEWTKNWLKIYFTNCSNYSKYKDKLNHFLWRSTCKSEEIIKMVKDEIKSR